MPKYKLTIPRISDDDDAYEIVEAETPGKAKAKLLRSLSDVYSGLRFTDIKAHIHKLEPVNKD